MKNSVLFVFLFCACTLISCQTSSDQTKMFVKSNVFDFKNTERGNKVSALFSITNVGQSPLQILGSSVSCGCTSISYSKTKIEPDASAEIRVSYDSSEDANEVLKTVIIKTNTKPALTTLYIKGTVIDKLIQGR